jgi:methionyl-tRNA formyltransferase
MSARLDLLVGGTLGGWALARAGADEVAQVVTDDPALAEEARRRGFAVREGGEWTPSARGLSVHYQRVVDAQTIARYDGLWNLHPGLLPWGRGFYPVFWALWEGTPAGATLHEMVAELDAGPIVDQVEVAVEAADTGASLHRRVQAAERELFERWWPRMLAGEPLPSVPQPAGEGSSHTRAEFHQLKREGWRALAPAELARLERCLEFPGYGGVERDPAPTADG